MFASNLQDKEIILMPKPAAGITIGSKEVGTIVRVLQLEKQNKNADVCKTFLINHWIQKPWIQIFEWRPSSMPDRFSRTQLKPVSDLSSQRATLIRSLRLTWCLNSGGLTGDFDPFRWRAIWKKIIAICPYEYCASLCCASSKFVRVHLCEHRRRGEASWRAFRRPFRLDVTWSD